MPTNLTVPVTKPKPKPMPASSLLKEPISNGLPLSNAVVNDFEEDGDSVMQQPEAVENAG